MNIHAYIVTVRRQGPDYTYKQELELSFQEYQVFMEIGDVPQRLDDGEGMPCITLIPEIVSTEPILEKPGRPAKDAPA